MDSERKMKRLIDVSCLLNAASLTSSIESIDHDEIVNIGRMMVQQRQHQPEPQQHSSDDAIDGIDGMVPVVLVFNEEEAKVSSGVSDLVSHPHLETLTPSLDGSGSIQATLVTTNTLEPNIRNGKDGISVRKEKYDHLVQTRKRRIELRATNVHQTNMSVSDTSGVKKKSALPVRKKVATKKNPASHMDEEMNHANEQLAYDRSNEFSDDSVVSEAKLNNGTVSSKKTKSSTVEENNNNKKQQASYMPGNVNANLSKDQLSAWRKEARRVRNRESAASSRMKTKNRIEELESEVDTLKAKYAIALEHYNNVLNSQRNNNRHPDVSMITVPDVIRQDLLLNSSQQYQLPNTHSISSASEDDEALIVLATTSTNLLPPSPDEKNMNPAR